jgi:hypothetical protein
MRIMTRGASPATIALAAALGVGLAGAHSAAAQSQQGFDHGPSLTLLSPAPHSSFQGTRPIEIDALYEGTTDNKIVSLSLYIDGTQAQSQTLSSPETKGMVSFLVDASLLSSGHHFVVVRATAADAEVRSVRGAFLYESGDAPTAASTGGDPYALDWPSSPGVAPQIRLISPAPNTRVQGTVNVQVDANDADGKPPYVSIFVDGEMKQLVNYRPFEFSWDTSNLSNGWHTIAVVEAFDDASVTVAHINPIRVYVNNPGGQTDIRTDLRDGISSVRPALSAPFIAPRSSLHKVQTVRPMARRPLGTAAMALPALPVMHPQAGHHALIAEMNPRWDRQTLLPALSDPIVPNNSDTHSKPKFAHARRAKPFSAPWVAGMPTSKQSHAFSAPTLLAERNVQDEPMFSPLLSLPELAAMPPRIAVTVPQPHHAATRLRMLSPALPVHARATVRPHTALGSVSLLRAVGEQQVRFNNTNVELERPLVAQHNILFSPLRRIFEQGGGTLAWNSHAGVVTARTATRDIQLTIGQTQATVNNHPFQMNGAPFINAGRTMVPLSFVGVAMDANVQYDPATGHLKITSRH